MYQHVNLWFVSFQKGYKFYDYSLARKEKRFQNWYYFHYYKFVELVFVFLYVPVSSKYCLNCCTDTRIWCLSTKAMQQWLLSYTWGCKECIITYNGGIPTVGRIAGLHQRGDDIVLWLWRQCTSTFSCSWWGY